MRLSFNASWPYPKAFTDRFTSKLAAPQAARELALAAQSSLTGVLHIGGPRQSYFDFARSLAPDVLPMTIGGRRRRRAVAARHLAGHFALARTPHG